MHVRFDVAENAVLTADKAGIEGGGALFDCEDHHGCACQHHVNAIL